MASAWLREASPEVPQIKHFAWKKFGKPDVCGPCVTLHAFQSADPRSCYGQRFHRLFITALPRDGFGELMHR